MNSSTRPGDKFELFVSYSRAPDGRLAKEIEKFLESFHKTPLLPEIREAEGEPSPPLPTSLEPLQVCVDSSDFRMPPPGGKSAPASSQKVLDVAARHLAEARELLVLCSSGSRASPWVEKEVEWFLEHRGASAIRLAITEGEDPLAEPEKYFPPILLEHGLHHNIAYDFRGFRRREAAAWKKVADFEREMVRLAADLHGLNAGSIYPSWFAEERRKMRRRLVTTTVVASVLVALSLSVVFAVVSASRERDRRRTETGLRLVADGYEALYREPGKAFLNAFEASNVAAGGELPPQPQRRKPGERAEEALRSSHSVALLHHLNRREIAQFTGSGPGYLAARWKQGQVFTVTSPDGRYQLLVTERGSDGATPPGDVYLVHNGSLRVRKLEPLDRLGGRVEFVGFDRDVRHVFVTRYFNLTVYGLDGIPIGSYACSRHTKSPVHLVEGYLNERWVLVAESKGGVWLVDPLAAREDSRKNQSLEIRREWAGDALTFARTNKAGTRAVLVFESGNASVLGFDSDGTPREIRVPRDDILFAEFVSDKDERIVTSGEDGFVRFWRLESETWREEAAYRAGSREIDWVTFSPDGRRILAIGSDGSLAILDRENGARLARYEDQSSVEWEAARALGFAPQEVPRPNPIPEPEPRPFPLGSVPVRTVRNVGGETWVFTHEDIDGSPLKRGFAYRVEGDQAVPFPDAAQDVVELEERGDLLLARGSWSEGYAAYRRSDEGFVRYPSADVRVHSIEEIGGARWVGTSGGAFREHSDAVYRMTPADWDVKEIVAIDDGIWLATDRGAYFFRGERLFSVTEAFLEVRTVRRVGDDVWILTEVNGSAANVFRVEGYMAVALPNRHTRIFEVTETAGRTWLFGEDSLYAVDAEEVRQVRGLEDPPYALHTVGSTIWVETQTRGILPARRPYYVLESDGLTAVRSELPPTAVLFRGGGQTWASYPAEDGTTQLVRLEGPRWFPVDIGGASLRRIREVSGEIWFATSEGVRRGAAAEPLQGVGVDVRDVVEHQGKVWFLGQGAAVRLDEDGPRVFEIGAHLARGVRSTGGRTWILGEGRFESAGPAYLLDGSRSVVASPPDVAVQDVVEIAGQPWFGTQVSGTAGPLVWTVMP